MSWENPAVVCTSCAHFGTQSAMLLLWYCLTLAVAAAVADDATYDGEDTSSSRVKRQFNFARFQGHAHNHGRFPQNHGGFFPQSGGFFPHSHGGFFPQNQHFPQGVPFPSTNPGATGGHEVSTPQTFIREGESSENLIRRKRNRGSPAWFNHGSTNFAGPNGYVPANQGRGGPNCRGNRRNNPECLQGGFSDFANTGGGNRGNSGNKNKNKNCNGNRKNRPECNFHTEPLDDEKVITAFHDIAWLAHLSADNHSIGLPNLPGTPSAQAQSRNFLLGVNQADTPFQQCRTPRSQAGHCRYLQHCILPEFVNSFQVFLQYVCFIQGTYVGVCCPDSRYPQSTTTTTTSTTTTTTPRPKPVTQPSNRGCGLSAKQQTRIVGGRNADPQEWPWMAALLRDGTTQYCGGALISDRHVLTAAHCVQDFTADRITVRLGEYTFDNPDDATHHDYPVQSIQKHAQYDTTTFVNDIAILSLPQSVVLSDDVWPVCLPQPGPLYTDEQPTVTGWGTIYYGGPVATTLQEVTIPVWSNEDCDDTYEQTIVDTVMCAGAKTGGKDSCQGDSGGPLLLRSPQGRWEVIGVVSWGIRCAEPGFPGVYTRVNRYLDWIRNNSL